MSDMIEQIQNSGFKAVLVMTGGGTEAIPKILTHPGASRFMLECQVPYSEEAIKLYLSGYSLPGSLCSQESAKLLAREAYSRALDLAGDEAKVVGFSCTAALQTTRARRGEDRALFGYHLGDYDNDVIIHTVPHGSRAYQESNVCDAFLRLVHLICMGMHV